MPRQKKEPPHSYRPIKETCPYCGAVTYSQALHVFFCPVALGEDTPDGPDLSLRPIKEEDFPQES